MSRELHAHGLDVQACAPDNLPFVSFAFFAEWETELAQESGASRAQDSAVFSSRAINRGRLGHSRLVVCRMENRNLLWLNGRETERK